MPNWDQIAIQVQRAKGVSLNVGSARALGGGCISSAYVVDEAQGTNRFFIKVHQATGLAMFEAEFEGLIELQKGTGLHVPVPLYCGCTEADAYLVMEYIPLQGGADDARLGEALAALHQNQQRRFGWQRDNTIGSTPQMNAWGDDWPQFWAEQRLAYQLRLAAKNGAGQVFVARAEQLQAALPVFFSAYQPTASLLHGDLWSGNFAFDQQGWPVIFDPAVYYGDRETDLAMTELFGGFSPRFYAAYNQAWPLDAGYATRKTLYNLYHILNHFNLFGGGYLSQAQGMVDRLLAEC